MDIYRVKIEPASRLTMCAIAGWCGALCGAGNEKIIDY